mgnify:CR=1 FL=1
MIDLSPQDLTTIKRILARFVAKCDVWAFGSRATWNAKSYSDLDLVVVCEDKVPRRILSQLKNEFAEAPLPFRIDVLDWHRVSFEFRENIKKHCERIQSPREETTLPHGWSVRKISEIADVIGGGTPKTDKAEYWGGDIPWITPKDLSREHPRYVANGERSITQKGLNNSSARMLPPKTVLLTSRAPVGYVALAGKSVATNQGLRNLVVRDGYDPEFIYYLLLQNTDYLKQHAAGSTFQELSGTTLKSLEFLIPPLNEQRAIAHILGSLDDKIELNREMNQTLEQMAQAIFKSWFIDFDPVVYNALQAGNPIPERFAETAARYREKPDVQTLPQDILDLFPDRFEESELGEMPAGWEPSTVGAIFDITMVQSPPSSTYNENLEGPPFFQGRRDFGFRYPNPRVYCSVPKRIATQGDTLISVQAPVGDLNMAFEECCIGRGVTTLRHKQGFLSFIYYCLQTLTKYFCSYEGEGTVFGSINKKQISNLPCIIPPVRIIEKFEQYVEPINEKIRSNVSEMVTLAEIRDTLLPKLVSGEVTISDAEKIVENAE